MKPEMAFFKNRDFGPTLSQFFEIFRYKIFPDFFIPKNMAQARHFAICTMYDLRTRKSDGDMIF